MFQGYRQWGTSGYWSNYHSLSVDENHEGILVMLGYGYWLLSVVEVADAIVL